MPEISVIIITLNEENNIGDCLESLKWAEEIIVIDSYSTDKTVEIAKKYTDKIIFTRENTFAAKRNLGIEQAKGDWILWIDADERVTDELRNEILSAIESQNNDTVFKIKRRSFFINKFIKHCGWYPDYTIRLFKKSLGLKFNKMRVHEGVEYHGKTRKLKNEIKHYTDLTFEYYMNKLNSYTTRSALDSYESGKTAGIFDIIFRPAFTFIKMYFLKLGILDGYMGLVLCTLSSIHVMFKYSKLYFLKPN